MHHNSGKALIHNAYELTAVGHSNQKGFLEGACPAWTKGFILIWQLLVENILAVFFKKTGRIPAFLFIFVFYTWHKSNINW